MALYDELVFRGLIKDVSNESLAKEKLNNTKFKFYCGFDPTGKSLTIGHLVQIVRMKLLEQYGHTPVVLIGGATGLIGDPRQTSERKLLTLEESLNNASMIQKQISKYLNPQNAVFVNNNDWISQIDMISFLRDYGKNFNLNYMLAKETVQSRIETGISYTEFSYMLIQAIDFWYLYKHHDVKVQFGGSDQWGNITTGLELIRKLEGDNDALGLSSPLLLKSDGNKFGKSENGALWLDSDLTSPYEVYQYFLNADDNEVITFLKTLTLLSKDEILELESRLKANPERREAQKTLAYEVVRFIHGEELVQEALQISEALFAFDFKKLSLKSFDLLTRGLNKVEINKDTNIIDALLLSSLVSSKREAREFIQSGAIYVNDFKIDSFDYFINESDSYFNKYVILRRGKKKYVIITIK